ncbi:MAG: hypothetical protein KC613_26120 [Myxococcales bacterium]|nr:hypothetical protein [Myxococcales bacterium]
MVRRLTGIAAGAVDAGVVRALQLVGRKGRPPRPVSHPGAVLRELAEVARAYPADAPDFWRGPEPHRTPVSRLVHPLARGALLELTWPSDERPYREGARLKTQRRNRTAVARLHAHQAARPTVVLVHGYGAGQWRTEQRLWPLRALYDSGLDVAQIVLPFHGVRADPRRRGGPPFPSANPRRTIEGMRQAVHDLLDLVGWLQRRGAPRVGVVGMSLGAYVSALAATVHPLDALGLMIPLASLADYARDHGGLAVGEVGRTQHAAIERAYGIIDPLARAPQVGPGRVWIAAADADRITPPQHAARLAAHLGAPVQRWPGGHLLQIGRKQADRDLLAFLRRTLTVA